MYRYGRGIRFLSSATTSNKSNWDPTVALELNHPSLILLEKCSTRHHFKQILGQIMRTNLIGQTFPMSRLLLFSASSYPNNLDLAIHLFNHFTPYPNLYIYNTMILSFSGLAGQSFAVYNSMLQSGIYPDKQTFLYLLKTAKCVMELKQIHCHALVVGLLSYVYLQNSLLKMYLEKGETGIAHQIFDIMPTPDVVSSNIMIVSYAKKGDVLEAFEMFWKMVGSGLEPDEFTMLGLLVCCGQLGEAKLGKSVHAWIERNKSTSSSNLILGNALLDMYVKCKELEHAHRIFNALPEKDTITWNTMIAGYTQVGELELACAVFDQTPKKDHVSWNSLISGYTQKRDFTIVTRLFICMLSENVGPDNVTMINLISSAAEIGALDQGRWIHGLLIKMKMRIDAFLGSGLIDMYSKCGSIERALLVFKQLTERDVTVWTTMITGLAFHGHGEKALQLFSDMQQETTPNSVTLVSVLTACSHSGLIEKGVDIFNNMKKVHDIYPGVEHYGCLVDLLGRSGRLSAAIDVIQKMPMKPSQTIWGAMLSACRAYKNVEIAEIAVKELLKLEPEREGGYVMLSNIYANCGKWSYSDKIREIMDSRGVKKIAGCSIVMVDGVFHDFVAADKTHPRWVDIFFTLHSLKHEMTLKYEY